MEKFNEYKNIALLFVLSSLWALHFSLVKLVEADDSPLTILVSLLAVLCALFFILLLLQNKLFKFTFKKSLFFSVAGMFAYIIPLSVEFIVAPKIEAGILTLIVSAVPVFTLIVIWIFRLLNVTVKLVIGTLSGLAGLLILFYGNNDNTSVSIWTVYALIIPLSYAFDAIFMEKFWPRNLDSTQVAFGETTASLIFVILLSIFYGNKYYDHFQWFTISSFWILAFVTFIEVWLFFYILNKVGAVFVNLSSYLVMPAGFLWGFLIFGETFTFIKFISTLLICISIFMIANQQYRIKNIPID
jgi:drug/metabolite transporter (DMT)-like permease|tara:strand:- start:229 stop:1128 length:900 start_codon:yes stop_codon:yes gene_type:complete